MKYVTGNCIAVVLLCAFTSVTGGWQTGFEQAKQQAAAEHKYILLNFSGSDWCGPCIRLKETVFNTPAFVQFADSSLVLLNADFPRQKKNRLPEALQQQNDALAERYNKAGNFPCTVLLTADGRLLKEWVGLPKENAAEFINAVNSTIHENRR